MHRNTVLRTNTMASNVTMRERKFRTPEEAISECEREMAVRVRCYDRWVSEGKLSSVEAVDRLDRMATAIDLLSTHPTYVEQKDKA